MSTARKAKTRSKAATPPKTPSVNDFLKPKSLSDKPKKSSKKKKPVSHFPTTPDMCDSVSLADKMDAFAAVSTVLKAAKRKEAELRSSLKDYLLENFAHAWASAKNRPPTRTWKAVKSSMDYVMTSFIDFKASKAEAIQKELGIDMAEHFEVSGFKIDLKKLEEHPEYMKAFMEFLGKISDEDRESDSIVERIIRLKKSFFNNMSEICDHNPDRLHRMLQILDPRTNFSNVKSVDSEEDMFDFVRDLDG